MKIFKRTLLIVLVVVIAYAVFYASRALPILTGFGAKQICSCVMLAGRDPQNVIDNELGRFPLSLGTFSVDYKDSSATAKVLGMATKKAIFRKGLGCTLISGTTEEEVRAQHFNVPTTVKISDSVSWPSGEKKSGIIPAGVDIQKITQVLDKAFDEPGEKKLRRLRAVVIVYDGEIIAERYADGFHEKSKHHGWSMTKSITNALVGILVGQGKLKVEEPAPVAAWKNDERNKITLENLLQASSGLRWKENYAGPSEATNMLFKEKDMGLYTETAPLSSEPGKIFYYSSGTPNVIQRIIREKVGDEKYHAFAATELFNKIGMHSAVIEPDAGGTFVGSSYSFATARDWARFGLLYLNDGVWQGERILPEGWVRYTSTPAQSAPIGEYGALFWLNAGASGNPAHRRYPDAPTDVFGADGFEGQNVWIVPSKKLVIARLSLEQGNYLDENKFVADIVNAMP